MRSSPHSRWRASWRGDAQHSVETRARRRYARLVAAYKKLCDIVGDSLNLDLALERRLAVRVRFSVRSSRRAGELDVLTDAYPEPGQRRDAWLHTVRGLVARNERVSADDVDLDVVAVRDEDEETAAGVAESRYRGG